ncbi:SigB/SigF/SigG family RNA polymerase sigma factor [Nocardia sp. NPDC088792]|uniref:SigB/SigF/SigG family RNA polymerase sigma factor n=1 Tax=Nocardia sp. NPDC088792 TaxID=3364332 RepID=UPI0037F48280
MSITIDHSTSRQSARTVRVGAARPHRRPDSYDHIEPLFAELAALDAADPRRKALREELIGRCLPLAANIARKYAGRGENFEDLLQTARVGMVVAIDRFDVEYGVPFLSFAIPTILGEVRRHFRDYTWAVQVPRQLKEIQVRIGPAVDGLIQRLGHMPTVTQIAAELGADRLLVTQALIARNAYRSSSLDACLEDDRPPQSLLDSLGIEETQFRTVEDRMAVRPLIAALSERDRRVLAMRFFGNQTQARIAESVGVSQMQVSRILSQTLNMLHEKALRD